MKKIVVIIAFLIFLISLTILGYLLVPTKNEDGTISIKEENNATNEISYGDDSNQNNIQETSQTDEKIAYKAKLIINKYFSGCKHTITSTVEMPSDMVNLTEEELKEKYNTWQIVSFSKNKVSIYKEFEGICNEHYIVTIKDNYIVIYKVDEKDKRSLYEQTDIITEYLPQEDIAELTNGISIEGVEKLNELMENYE